MAIDWKQRIADAKAAAIAEKAKITPEDQEEIDARALIVIAEAEREAAAKIKRDVDLARRLDAAREKHGQLVESVSISGREDTFVVKCDPDAHAQWEKDLSESAQNKKINRKAVAVAYAAALVIDWNGETDFASSENGNKLINYLKTNSAMTTPIVNAGAKLAGFFAEESKS